jgi:hypothetical protein
VRDSNTVKLTETCRSVVQRSHGPRDVEVGVKRSDLAHISARRFKDEVLDPFKRGRTDRNAAVRENSDDSRHATVRAALEEIALEVVSVGHMFKDSRRVRLLRLKCLEEVECL